MSRHLRRAETFTVVDSRCISNVRVRESRDSIPALRLFSGDSGLYVVFRLASATLCSDDAVKLVTL
ncbi:MAG: hypothetical protein ACK526_09695 [Planctomyces sp.]|jgi:hypothetical protein